MRSALRALLYTTAAVTGACVMIVEILGAKVLAPFMGTSHYVWTAQITVTMLSLAAGYYYGGRLVDVKPDLNLLYLLVFGAALYLLAGVWLSPLLGSLLSGLTLALGSFSCSFILYAPPLTVLSCVNPFLVRLLTSSLLSAGRMAGRISAVGTAGSLLGTVSISYLLLPLVANSTTMLLVVAALLLICAIYALLFRGYQLPPAAEPVVPSGEETVPPPAGPAPQGPFLYLVTALAGACVMLVEILGTKVLGPFMGHSHFVWTAQITITMVSLAIGYYYGGRLIGEGHGLSLLFGLIYAAALYLALGITACPPLAERLAFLPPPTASLLCALLLFGPPLTCLAMVCPFVIGFFAHSMQSLGTIVGRLSAVSTAGSLAGTVLIGYLILPLCSTSTTMLMVAGSLSLTSVIFWAGRRRLLQAGLAALVMAVVVGLTPPSGVVASNGTEIFSGNSPYGLLQVFDLRTQPLVRVLVNNHYVQNMYNVSEDAPVSFEFGFHGLLRLYLGQIPQNVLFVGMGAGLGPSYFRKTGSQVDVVEIDPLMVVVAERLFRFDRSRFRVRIEDGRCSLARLAPQSYDGIVLDVFLGASPPGHLMTRESFAQIKQLLKPDGVLVINTNFVDVKRSRSFKMLHRTLASVFPHIVIHRAGLNAFVVASSRDLSQTRMELPPDLPPDLPPAYRDVMATVLTGVVEVDSSAELILTDDFNPFDYYDAEERDHVHRSLRTWLKQLLGTP